MQRFQILIHSPIPPDRHLLPSILILPKIDTHNSDLTPHSPGFIALSSRQIYFASILDTYLSGDITSVFLRAETQPLQKISKQIESLKSNPITILIPDRIERRYILPVPVRVRVRFPFLPAMSRMTLTRSPLVMRNFQNLRHPSELSVRS